MIRHFNYTKRKKIPRDQLRFVWKECAEGPLDFEGDIRLKLEGLPLDADVVVEAYSGPVIMRFQFGNVSHVEAPEDTRLVDFPPGLKPLLRVKVVSNPGGESRILAWANAVSPLSAEEAKTGRRSIFPVELVDLGPLVWDVRLEDNTPILQLNAKIREPRDISTLSREPDFLALVYPAAIRRVFEHLFNGSESENVESDHPWLKFGRELAKEECPRREKYPDGDDGFLPDVNEWIQKVLCGFCERYDTLGGFVRFRKEWEAGND